MSMALVANLENVSIPVSQYNHRMLERWLHEALAASKISQAELSRRLTESLGRSIDRAAVNKMVKGTREISAAELIEILAITGAEIPGDHQPNATIARGVNLLRKTQMRVIDGTDLDPPDQATGDEPATIGTETGVRGIPDDTIGEIDVVSGLGGGGITTTTEVSAANGMSFSADVIRDHWRIPNRLLGHAGAKPKHIAALPVQGDSMSPTIRDGDVVFVDTRHRVPSPPGLYALADEFGGMIVKRLDVVSKPSDEYVEVSIISDNQNHSARTLTLDEIAIVGRVIGRFTTS